MVNRRVGNMRKDRDDARDRGFFSRYRPPPADHVKRQAERRGGKFDSIFKGNFDTFTPKEGDNTVRVLPAGWEGHDDYAYQVWVHFGIGADECSYLCLRKMKNDTCPICQEVARMRADGETDDAKRIDCKERLVCWIIDRSDRDETPALYSMPATLYKDINALCYSSRTGKAIFVDNPDDGYDITIRRTGTKINTRYLPQVDREPTAVTGDPEKYKELEDFVQDNQIPDCLQFFDAEYLERALSGDIDRNQEPESESRSSGNRSSTSREEPARGDRDRGDDRRSSGGRQEQELADSELDELLPFDDRDAESANEGREAGQDRDRGSSSRRSRDGAFDGDPGSEGGHSGRRGDRDDSTPSSGSSASGRRGREVRGDDRAGREDEIPSSRPRLNRDDDRRGGRRGR